MAHFQIGGAGYVVIFGMPEASQGVIVRDDDVTFDLDPLLHNRYELTPASTDAISVKSAGSSSRLAIVNGLVAARGRTLISGGPGSQLEVAHGGTLTLGQLNGESGSATVVDNGQIDASQTIIVGVAGVGIVSLAGAAGHSAVITNDPDGTGTTFIASQPGSVGSINITGLGAAWRTHTMYLAGKFAGELKQINALR